MNYELYRTAIQLIDRRHSEDVQEVQARFAYSNAIAKIGDEVKTITGEEFTITEIRVTLDPVSAMPILVYGDVHTGCFIAGELASIKSEVVK